jgi:putative transposase
LRWRDIRPPRPGAAAPDPCDRSAAPAPGRSVSSAAIVHPSRGDRPLTGCPDQPWCGEADSIYDRLAALLACFLFGLALVIVRRAAGATGFVVQPRRWVVERSLGWLNRWRRLSKDYEELPEVSEAMVTLAMIRLMLHRVVHPNRRRLPAP